MSIRFCLIVTDAISFNGLYPGQLEFLKANDFSLTLICGGVSDDLAALAARDVGEVIDLGFVRPPAPLKDIKALLRLIRSIRKTSYDVVLYSTPKAILLGAMAAYVTQQPRRIVFFQGRVYENMRSWRRWFYSTLDRLAIRLSTHAVFVSSSLLDAYVVEGLVKDGQGHVVGSGSCNGVDLTRFTVAAADKDNQLRIRAGLSIGKDELMVLSVGRICKDKGLSELLELSKRFEDQPVRFVWVGVVEEEDAELAVIVLNRPNVSHVPFTWDIAQYFAAADVHLLLSHREGLGNVAIEAASAGLPTIAFDVVGVKDSVACGISGERIPFGDLAAIQEILQAALRDRRGWKQQYSGAQTWVQERFGQQQVWRDYLDFYRKVMGDN